MFFSAACRRPEQCVMHRRHSRRAKHFKASENVRSGSAVGSRPLRGALADDQDVFACGKEKLRTSIVYSGPSCWVLWPALCKQQKVAACEG